MLVKLLVNRSFYFRCSNGTITHPCLIHIPQHTFAGLGQGVVSMQEVSSFLEWSTADADH